MKVCKKIGKMTIVCTYLIIWDKFILYRGHYNVHNDEKRSTYGEKDKWEKNVVDSALNRGWSGVIEVNCATTASREIRVKPTIARQASGFFDVVELSICKKMG